MAKRRLRLIHSGRLLTNGTFLFDWLISLEERQHRAVHQKGGDSNNDEEDGSVPVTTAIGSTWLHCSVGAEIFEGEDELDDGKPAVRLSCRVRILC